MKRKFTPTQVLEIRAARDRGVPLKELRALYPASLSALSTAANNHTYRVLEPGTREAGRNWRLHQRFAALVKRVEVLEERVKRLEGR